MNVKIDLSKLPKLPGIYIFKDKYNNVLYIGKALSIRDRVKSYFFKGSIDWKLHSMLDEAVDVSFVVTQNEAEAFLLEAQLIKDNQPKYNILLKDGQPFIYYVITDSEFPIFEIRRDKSIKGKYFGPFFNKQIARRVYDFLIKEFRLKNCNKKIDTGCLEYHLEICSGICRSSFDLESYKFRLNLIEDLLEDNIVDFNESIQKEIAIFIEKNEFEKAAQLHKYIEGLEEVLKIIRLNFDTLKYRDTFVSSVSGLLNVSVPYENLGQELKSLIQVDFIPKTIDCFDISHFQGKWIVGSCVRFNNGKPEKNKFRRFKIKSLDDQNDYEALKEIVARRYRDGDKPDLVLIDGGKGQLSAVNSVLQGVAIISLAKKEERLFGPNFSDGIVLDKSLGASRLLMAIRDYAHHFAVNYHRKKRSL